MTTLQEQLNQLRKTCTPEEWATAVRQTTLRQFTAYIAVHLEGTSISDAEEQIPELLGKGVWSYTADYIQEQ